MDEIAISKFKATCLAVLEQVRRSGKPILVTRFGLPIAEIRPPECIPLGRRFGLRTQTGVILGDIVGPTGEESDWDAARDPGEEVK